MEEVSRSNFWFKRIHSFVGVVPLGVFILFHFIFHASSNQGPAVYDGRLRWLYSLPILETFRPGVRVPIPCLLKVQ